MASHMLTTTDNPYSPFTQWAEWYTYDTSSGYNTSSLLARILTTSDELSEADQDLDMENAINFIILEGYFGPYKKVTEADYATTSTVGTLIDD